MNQKCLHQKNDLTAGRDRHLSAEQFLLLFLFFKGENLVLNLFVVENCEEVRYNREIGISLKPAEKRVRHQNERFRI